MVYTCFGRSTDNFSFDEFFETMLHGSKGLSSTRYRYQQLWQVPVVLVSKETPHLLHAALAVNVRALKAKKSVLPIEILSEGQNDTLSTNPRVKQPKLEVTTLK